MEHKHLSKPEENWIEALIKSAVAKVILWIVAFGLSMWGGYAIAVWRFGDKMEDMQSTIVGVVAVNEQMKKTQLELLKNSSSTAVIDTIRSFRYDMKALGMSVTDLQNDFIVYKAQYYEDTRELQRDIKEILRSQRMGALPDTTYYPLTLSTN